MLRRLVPVLIAVAGAGCSGEDPPGAARVAVHWTGFSPGCVKLSAWDRALGESSTERSQLGLQTPARQGDRVFAVYRKDGWGPEVTIRAEALEGGCDVGTVVARAETTVTIADAVVEQSLSLAANDLDEDGFVSSASDLPGSDCDDGDPRIHPGVAEICDGRDQDCDGLVDEDVGTPYYRDADGDGFGDPRSVLLACSLPEGYVAEAGDCDDTRDTVKPGATELCDGLDNDCNGSIDDGLTVTTWYVDADGDGHGDSARPQPACAQPPGHVANSDDCNDAAAQVFPGATEICNGVDDDCDGETDEGVLVTFYRDADGDTWGDSGATQKACTVPPGYTVQGGDCDDTRADAHPNAAEICNGLDDNCDGQVDEGVKLTFYRDADGDGFGVTQSPQQACSAPAGYSATPGDCDDAVASVNPGATEVCNGIDDNCNGQTDEGVKSTFHQDADGDGYGNPAVTAQQCAPSAGWVVDGTDCDDTLASVRPNAPETCNGIDDNCNGQTDEGVTQSLYVDADRDGRGDPGAMVQACPGPGYAAVAGDCDDGNPFRYPGMTEHCDGLDNDCDGQIDQGLTCAGASWAIPADPGGGGHDWRSVSVYAPGNAWASGRGGKLRHFSGNSSTTSEDGDCSGDWDGAWAAADGTVYLASSNGGKVASHALGGNCGPILVTTSNELRGIVGFPSQSGPTLFAVGTDGKVIRWQSWQLAGSALTELTQLSGVEMWDVDGPSAASLIAVGAQSGKPAAVRRNNGSFATVPLPTGLSGYLRRVSSVHQTLAFAAGDGGTVLKWDGTAWTALPAIAGAGDLQAIKAFGANLVYVAGATNGGFSLWRWNGLNWTAITTLGGDAPRDLDGSAPWDLWVVGDKGLVRHYSE